MSKNFKIIQKSFFVAVFFFLLMAAHAKAATLGDLAVFTVDPNFDSSSRAKIQSVLVKASSSLYIYIDKSWWDQQTSHQKSEISGNLDALSSEFSNRMYPTLTSVFGQEWTPGIDGDSKTTVFFHTMKNGVSGYFRSADEYFKIQVPDSNEREMIYLSTADITSLDLKTRLAHEFVHLITFNQKERLQDVQEEVWLNEARAEYASSILGYDTVYEGSDLQRRVNDFLANPSVPITEWKNSKYNYAAIKMFVYYLVDNYGIGILSDSMKLKSVGIESINRALTMNGVKKDFSQIFTDWTIANIINDCSSGTNYCYRNKHLENLKISPPLNFLPLSGDSSLTVKNSSKNWLANWQKIIGGNGDLTLTFEGLPELNYKVPYILDDNKYSVHFMTLDKGGRGSIKVRDFGAAYSSLIIIPSLQSKTSGFNGLELAYPYTFTVSTTKENQEDPALIQQLLGQIESLKKQIAQLQGSPNSGASTCSQIINNLYIGLSNNSEVMCLQEFLKSQGADIYPEGLVTGKFGSFTKAAVIRFQERYRSEVLVPAGLPSGTGYVGALTRAKINQFLK